jgi:hypothetical protein
MKIKFWILGDHTGAIMEAPGNDVITVCFDDLDGLADCARFKSKKEALKFARQHEVLTANPIKVEVKIYDQQIGIFAGSSSPIESW